MKKNLKIISVLTVLMLAFLISPLQVSAAQPIAKEYTVTYRPGNIARFSDALVQKYQEYYREENVSVSQATGSISITVQAGSFYPEAPSAEDIVMDEAACVPVAYYNDFWLQSEKITGTWHSAYGYWHLMYGDIAE